MLDAAKVAGADGADAMLARGHSTNISLRLGNVEASERSEDFDIGLRVFIGQRTASISTSQLDSENITSTNITLPISIIADQFNLNVVGLMCIPPADEPSTNYFKEMYALKNELNLEYLSMGMSADYIEAIKNSATHLRIGSNIFGNRI